MVKTLKIFMKRKAELDFVLDGLRDEMQAIIESEDAKEPEVVFNLLVEIDTNNIRLVNLQSELISFILKSEMNK